MEEYDELERMRERRRRQKAGRQQRVPDSSRSRREPEIRYYNDDYDYEKRRRGRGSRRDYDDRDEYDDYEDDNRGRYDDYDREYDGYDDYVDDYDDNSHIFQRQSSRGREGGRSTKNGRKSGREEQARGSKKGKKKHRYLFLKIILLLLILAGAYFVYKYKQTGTGYWTVAVFGVDSREGNLEKGALSDVEMICVIDRQSGDIKLISVFRDTYLEINPDGTYHKINEAYFKGGHEQAVQALERNLDLSIDDYVTFNWKAVVDAINILGGIDLEISDSEFKYINSFITETVESTGIGSYHLEHAGMNHLDGIQAVAYARLRLMDTDYNRTARQRLVIQLALNKAKEADLKTLTSLVQAVLPQTSTSISIDDLLPIARNISKFHIGETNGFPFSRGETHIGKRDCVIPLTLESNVIQLHQILYGIENFQPSETVRRISAQIASDSGMGEVAENAPEAKVLGQRALEDSGLEGSGGSGGKDNSKEGSGNTGGSPNPAPSSQPEAVPAQTEAAQEEPSETPPESVVEESIPDSSSPDEQTQEEETDETIVQPTEETEIGPGFPPPPESEAEPDAGQTEASSESPSDISVQPSAEETQEIGPGIS